MITIFHWIIMIVLVMLAGRIIRILFGGINRLLDKLENWITGKSRK